MIYDQEDEDEDEKNTHTHFSIEPKIDYLTMNFD